jgi:hypothetical protein
MRTKSASKAGLAVVLCFAMFLTACNSWPTIIATAEAISQVTSIFFPAVGSLSALAVQLLQDAETASQAYNANKSTSTEAAFVAAIQNIETNLPAAEAGLNIPIPDQQKVSAAVNIILDYVEALAGQLPAAKDVIAKGRAKRG